MILLLKLALFLLSLAGWGVFIARRFSIRIELTPFIVLSGMGVVLFGAGLLNIYRPVEWCLWLGGLALLLYCALRQKDAFAPWWSVRSAAFGAGTLWMLWLMRGGVLVGHDNMSHWGIMVKTMVRFDRLPNTQNQAVEFVSYPPGGSGLIKYFCDFVGTSDGMMMYAQGLLLLAGVFTLFALCPKKHWSSLALAAVSGVFLLVGNLTPADLRVDTLLAVQAVGALAIIAYYGPKQPQKAAWLSMSGLVLLALIKNSGLFFVAMDLVVLTWFLLRQKKVRRQNLIPVAAAWAAPLASFWLWTRHVAMVFPEGSSSKHAVSLSGYEKIFGGKTPEEMQGFHDLFFSHLVNFSKAENRCLWLLLVLMLCAVLWIGFAKALPGRGALLLGVALFGGELLYLVCLWATYVFSMTASEMLCLASFSRYSLTGILFFAGATVIALLWVLAQKETKGRAIAGAVFALAMAGLLLMDTPQQTAALVSRAPYRQMDTQGELLELKNQYGLKEGRRYLFYTRGDPEVDTWSMRYVARYVLNTDTVDFWQFPDQEFGYEDLYGHYDYLVLYAPDDASRQFLQQGNLDPDSPFVELIQ